MDGEEPVETRHADVVEAIDGISHDFEADGGFFGDREIRGSGGGDHHRAVTGWRVGHLLGNSAGEFVERRLGQDPADGLECGRRRAGYEEILAGRHDSLGDRGDLVRGLALPENDFGEALTYAPVVVDAGKSEVLVGPVAQKLKEAGVRRLRSEHARVDLVEEVPELEPVHVRKSLTRVDFRLSRPVISPIVPCDGFIFL
jgi:hypothetical protein